MSIQELFMEYGWILIVLLLILGVSSSIYFHGWECLAVRCVKVIQ